MLLAWKAARQSVSGHAGGYDHRRIVDAIFYQNRSGCQWSDTLGSAAMFLIVGETAAAVNSTAKSRWK